MKKLILTGMVHLSVLIGYAQSEKYLVEIDLTKTADDQIPVIITPPTPLSESVEFIMPKIVPGTYDISDFGRFVVDLKASDLEGNTLTTKRLDTNRWSINTTGKKYKITYLVNDTFDKFGTYGNSEKGVVFEPGGTNIDSDVFVLNTFGIIGFIKEQSKVPFELTIKHPEHLYGSTALQRLSSNKSEDRFIADDYNFLADGPIMYCEPDTITRKLGNASIMVSVYSPNKKLTSKEVMDHISDLMEAQKNFLGGELPVDRYAYLIFLEDKNPLSGKQGALEHSYSSLYMLPDIGINQLGQILRDVAAHEFLHIVTPLNIHAEQIGNFDYIQPEMSEHLWLYEGVTEYNSMLVQVKYNLYGVDEFLNALVEKMYTADEFQKGVSFTEMSRHILESEYEPMYENVYYKGALIGMCLDLYLLKYSDGNYNLQKLMKDLASKYGKNVSFKDEELFTVIGEFGGQEAKEFLETYVAGNKELPIQQVLNWVGINYQDQLKYSSITMGKLGLNVNEQGKIFIDDLSKADSFGKSMGFREGDIISKINNEDFSIQNGQNIMQKFKFETKADDVVTFEVIRSNKKGKEKTKVLKGKAVETSSYEYHVISISNSATKEQIKLLSDWTMAK